MVEDADDYVGGVFVAGMVVGAFRVAARTQPLLFILPMPRGVFHQDARCVCDVHVSHATVLRCESIEICCEGGELAEAIDGDRLQGTPA